MQVPQEICEARCLFDWEFHWGCGEYEMGFSQVKTTHHFQLTASGGVIEVQTNNPADTTTRCQIRQHLQGISKAFA